MAWPVVVGDAKASTSSKPGPNYSTLQKVGGGVLLGVGVAAVAPAIAVGALGAMGFSAAGPVAGTFGATTRATIGLTHSS